MLDLLAGYVFFVFKWWCSFWSFHARTSEVSMFDDSASRHVDALTLGVD